MKKHQLSKFVNEIEKRGGETVIHHMPYGRTGWKHAEKRHLEHLDTGKSEGRVVHLLGCEGWRYYSRSAPNRHATLRYLAGKDDSGLWAIRVPCTIGSASEAIDWIQPSAVKKARESRNYLRTDESFGDHDYYSKSRVVLHPEHRPLKLPDGRWQAIEQKSLFGSRGGAVD